MSTFALNTVGGKNIVNQGFLSGGSNPSGQQSSMRLSRRGRLARTLVVLSLAITMISGFAAQSGANQVANASEANYITVVVAPGETLWSLAAATGADDLQGMVNEIREVNNLKGFDLQAGEKLRVPTL